VQLVQTQQGPAVPAFFFFSLLIKHRFSGQAGLKWVLRTLLGFSIHGIGVLWGSLQQMLGFYEAGALTTADRNMFQKTAARLEKTSLQTQYTGVGVVGTGMGGVSGKAGMAGIEGMGITGVLGISGVSRVSRGSMDSRHTRHRDIRDRRDQTEAKRWGGG
jgi:hypothetical protein